MSTTARATTASRPESGVVVGLLLLAAVAGAGTVVLAQQMGVMAGTMGLAMPAFLLVWLLMMVAMMLPAVTPVARLYLRTIGRDRRALRVAGFLSGYLLVWTAAGLPAFGLAWGAQRLGVEHPGAARLAAARDFSGRSGVPGESAQRRVPEGVPITAGSPDAIRKLPRCASGPPSRRAPRVVLPRLLLGVVRRTHSPGDDEPRGDGGACCTADR